MKQSSAFANPYSNCCTDREIYLLARRLKKSTVEGSSVRVKNCQPLKQRFKTLKGLARSRKT